MIIPVVDEIVTASSTDAYPAGLAVFDVCDTLYYSNTTHDFVRYFSENLARRDRKVLFHLLNHRLSPLRYGLIAVSVATGSDLFRKASIRLLRGVKESELATCAARFIAEVLDMRKIERTHHMISEYRKLGLEVVLCSSSIEPVVREVATYLGVSASVSTILETREGILTGRIIDDPTGRKLAVLRERYGNTRIAYAVSDNVSDLELLLAADHGIAISHNTRKSRFWKDRKIELIDLGL